MSKHKYKYKIAHQIPYGRYISSVIVLICLFLIIRAFWLGKIHWEVVEQFLFTPIVIKGIINSIILTFAAMAVGLTLGLISALMTLSKNRLISNCARGYILMFRSVPVILQLLIWYNIALVFPTIGIPSLFSYPATEIITPFVAALLAFGLMQGAYTSEVIRAGLLSVGIGQSEAAKAIGMTPSQTMRRIVIPQAMVVIIPPIGNEVIGMVKYTALASVIQYQEILYGAQTIYYNNGRVIELLIVCAFWYFVTVSFLSIIQKWIENYFNKHHKG